MEESIRIGLLLDSTLYKEMQELIPEGEKSKIMRHLLRDLIRLLRAAKEQNCVQLTIGALLNGNIKLKVITDESSNSISPSAAI